MKVTIENYTECCLHTWGGENQKERAELGIIGELGEVAEVLKKYLRGDFDEVERDKRLLKELGDLLYYFAVDGYLNGIDIALIDKFHHTIWNCSFFELSASLNEYIGGSCESDYTEAFDVLNQFAKTQRFTLEQIMQANIDKLSDRAKRDKIKGDGDNR